MKKGKLFYIALASLLALGIGYGTARAFDYADVALRAGAYMDPCKSQKINDAIGLIQGSYIQQMENNVKAQFSPANMLNYATDLLTCIKKGVGLGFAKVETSTACSKSVGGRIEASLKAQFDIRNQIDFMNQCRSASASTQAQDDLQRTLNENGRDGGPTWVQDWTQFQAQSQNRGAEIARNQMARTNYCPWVRGNMQSIFNYRPEDSIDIMKNTSSNAECSFPAGVNIYDPSQQNANSLAAITNPENNIFGAYIDGLDSIYKNVQTETKSDEYEYVYSGGFGGMRDKDPQSGDSCIARAKNGTCLEYSKIKTPQGATESLERSRQQLFAQDLFNNPWLPDAENKLIMSMIDLTQPAPRFEFDIPGVIKSIAASNPPTPTPTNVPTVCSNLPADCACQAGDSAAQDFARTTVLPAQEQAIQQHPELISPDGMSVLPGKNINFLDAVCANLGSICRARPLSQSQIVIQIESIEFSVDIITSNGVIRKPGEVIAACTAGTL